MIQPDRGKMERVSRVKKSHRGKDSMGPGAGRFGFPDPVGEIVEKDLDYGKF
jgi:hypothetical protein